MERSKQAKEPGRVYNTDWAESIQSIVDRTENNLKGISGKDDPMYQPYTPSIPC